MDWDDFCKQYVEISNNRVNWEAEYLLAALKNNQKRISFKFAWYDLWVGLFYDRKNKIIYICPFPTFLIIIRI